MNYLVTGGAGFIGSELIKLLVKNGCSVFSIDRHPNKNLDTLGNSVRQVICDISDYSQLLASCSDLPKIDGIFHLAALKSVTGSESERDLYQRVNVLGTENVLKFMEDMKITKLLFASSAAVYGNGNGSKLLSETNAVSPINWYGTTKVLGENLINKFIEDHPDSYSCALRLFNVIGIGEGENPDIKGENAISIILNAISRGTRFKVFGNTHDTPDGSCMRDYISIKDTAEGFYRAMLYLEKHPKVRNETINLCSGIGTSVLQLVAEFRAKSVREFDFEICPSRPGEPGKSVGDPAKTSMILDWMPSTEVSESIHDIMSVFNPISVSQNYSDQ